MTCSLCGADVIRRVVGGLVIWHHANPMYDRTAFGHTVPAPLPSAEPRTPRASLAVPAANARQRTPAPVLGSAIQRPDAG